MNRQRFPMQPISPPTHKRVNMAVSISPHGDAQGALDAVERVRISVSKTDLFITIYVNENGHLVIQGDGPLYVMPRAANTIHLSS